MSNVTPAWFAAAVSRRNGWPANTTHDEFLKAGQKTAVDHLLERHPTFRPLFSGSYTIGPDDSLVFTALPARPASDARPGWYRAAGQTLGDVLGCTATVTGRDDDPASIRIEMHVIGRLPQPERPVGARVADVEKSQATEKTRLDGIASEVETLKTK